MTLNTRRSKIPHIHTTTIPESQISLFRSTINHFKDIGILGSLSALVSNWPVTRKQPAVEQNGVKFRARE